jgi:asparagine synthase (glutamine-hydrolysing)
MVRQILPWHNIWRVAERAVNILSTPPEIIERGLRSLSVANLGQRTLEACTLFPSKERQLLTGNNSDGNSLQIINEWLAWLSDCSCQSAEKMMRLDARMNLADDLLLYGDKTSMAVALEARVPLLDIELVQFVESLPLHYRIAFGKSKIVHKKMSERYLPDTIVHRKKKGFQVPFEVWSRGIWRDRIEKIIFDENSPHWTMLRRDGVKSLWKQHQQGKPDRSRQFFALLILALWWRQQ